MEVAFSERKIQQRIRQMAGEISRDYGREVVEAVGILDNGFMFLTDLVKHLTCPVICHFLKMEAIDTMEGGRPRRHVVYSPIEQIQGKNLLLVDAIVESGVTLDHLVQQLLLKEPKSVRTAALINREDMRHLPFSVDYSGFLWNGSHLVGYGLAKDGLYRNLPYMAMDSPAADRDENNRGTSKKKGKRKE